LISSRKDLEISCGEHFNDLPERRTVLRISFQAPTNQYLHHISVLVGKTWHFRAANPINDIQMRFRTRKHWRANEDFVQN
jgi:hypothetical protein